MIQMITTSLFSSEELLCRIGHLIAGLVDAPTTDDSRAAGFSRKELDGLEPAEMIAFRDQFSDSASFQLSLAYFLTSRVMRMIQRFAPWVDRWRCCGRYTRFGSRRSCCCDKFRFHPNGVTRFHLQSGRREKMDGAAIGLYAQRGKSARHIPVSIGKS